MVRLKLFILFLCVLFIENVHCLQRRIKYKGCYPGPEMPVAIFVNCVNRRGVCQLRKSQDHIVRIFFRPEISSKEVDSYLAWNSWIQMPLPNQEREACTKLHNCPTIPNALNSFTFKLTVEDFWPPGDYPLIWRLTDTEKDQEIMCTNFPIQII